MPETTISQRSHLANYFDDQNKSVQRHWIAVRWQHLLVAQTRIFWREGLLTQADCSSRDSRLSLLTAQCLLPHNTHAVHCGWRCRQRRCMRLQVTQSSAKVLTLFFVFYGHFSTKKKKIKRKCGCLFRPKNKTPKNKNAFSGAEK